MPFQHFREYRYPPEAERVVPERRFFRRVELCPGYHLHLVARSAPLWSNLLVFRNTLREDSSLAEEYTRIKLHLADSHSTDVDAYTVAKGPFVEKVLREAWRRGIDPPTLTMAARED